ncbi:hypothetical protein CAPTEDRAFT_222915 [Capitella teleta]|uniref:Secreted protein n=1 Tax=Capitella teleta TaxID=283909 RepID=R7VGV7_CAPTE|nr:hypothetical protein CAPTEDRAFT_222915 [Capitella teleta]|eukprot:ELU17792.1 hypothetical protein CAPTEDRAFT_222915 [Capitella teleta]
MWMPWVLVFLLPVAVTSGPRRSHRRQGPTPPPLGHNPTLLVPGEFTPATNESFARCDWKQGDFIRCSVFLDPETNEPTTGRAVGCVFQMSSNFCFYCNRFERPCYMACQIKICLGGWPTVDAGISNVPPHQT